MRIFKLIGAKVLALALAFSVTSAVMPSSVPLVGVTQADAQHYGGRHYRGGGRDYRGGRHYRGGRDYRGGRRYYGRDRYYRGRRNNGGAAIAGAIVGLGIGAAIASANEPRVIYRDAPTYYEPQGYRPYTRAWYRYCANRYRSFDPGSGTFQPYNGPRQLCR